MDRAGKGSSVQKKKKKSFKIADERVAGTCFAPPTSH